MNPAASLWRRLIQTASGMLLQRQALNPEALLGRQGEEAAYWYLRRNGFILVARNYRPRGVAGEIDLIGWESDTLVFFEVKTRSSSSYVTPETSVDQQKVRTLLAAARNYRRRANCFAAPYRFDIISAVPSPRGFAIEHFRDAFRQNAASASHA